MACINTEFKNSEELLRTRVHIRRMAGVLAAALERTVPVQVVGAPTLNPQTVLLAALAELHASLGGHGTNEVEDDLPF